MRDFEVVDPTGPSGVAALTENAALASLAGARIAFVWHEAFRGDEMFAIIRAEIERRAPGVEFVPYEHFGNPEGPEGPAMLADLPDRLREWQISAAMVGVGA